MLRKPISLIVIITFICSLVTPIPKAQAQGLLGLPEPGTMVSLSPAYQPAIIKGLTVHKDNPFLFDFIVDVGQDHLQGQALKNEGEKLIKYFLASLAIPEKDLWVNLSPYERDRIVPQALGQTEMGRDLLAQDYMLKQITASLIYPEKNLGKEFWDKVYAAAQEKFGTTQIPVNTFNKVWIMADKAEVFEHNQTVFVVDCHLKVMLEEDYLALTKHQGQPGDMALAVSPSMLPSEAALKVKATQGSNLTRSIIKRIILPQLEKEVNTGKNFTNLRQIFNSIILSSWYKNNLKAAILNQVYANKEKVKGIDLKDPTIKEQIYQRYLQAYKKGVFNYIKEEPTGTTTIPRKYFSGGFREGAAAPDELTETTNLQVLDAAMGSEEKSRLVKLEAGVKIRSNNGKTDAAMYVQNPPLIAQLFDSIHQEISDLHMRDTGDEENLFKMLEEIQTNYLTERAQDYEVRVQRLGKAINSIHSGSLNALGSLKHLYSFLTYVASIKDFFDPSHRPENAETESNISEINSKYDPEYTFTTNNTGNSWKTKGILESLVGVDLPDFNVVNRLLIARQLIDDFLEVGLEYQHPDFKSVITQEVSSKFVTNRYRFLWGVAEYIGLVNSPQDIGISEAQSIARRINKKILTPNNITSGQLMTLEGWYQNHTVPTSIIKFLLITYVEHIHPSVSEKSPGLQYDQIAEDALNALQSIVNSLRKEDRDGLVQYIKSWMNSPNIKYLNSNVTFRNFQKVEIIQLTNRLGNILQTLATDFPLSFAGGDNSLFYDEAMIGQLSEGTIQNFIRRLAPVEITDQTTGNEIRSILGDENIVLVSEINDEDELNQKLREGKTILAFHGSMRSDFKLGDRIPKSLVTSLPKGTDLNDLDGLYKKMVQLKRQSLLYEILLEKARQEFKKINGFEYPSRFGSAFLTSRIKHAGLFGRGYLVAFKLKRNLPENRYPVKWALHTVVTKLQLAFFSKGAFEQKVDKNMPEAVGYWKIKANNENSMNELILDEDYIDAVSLKVVAKPTIKSRILSFLAQRVQKLRDKQERRELRVNDAAMNVNEEKLLFVLKVTDEIYHAFLSNIKPGPEEHDRFQRILKQFLKGIITHVNDDIYHALLSHLNPEPGDQDRFQYFLKRYLKGSIPSDHFESEIIETLKQPLSVNEEQSHTYNKILAKAIVATAIERMGEFPTFHQAYATVNENFDKLKEVVTALTTDQANRIARKYGGELGVRYCNDYDHGRQHAADLLEKAVSLAIQTENYYKIDWDVLIAAIALHDIFAYQELNHGPRAIDFAGEFLKGRLSDAQIEKVQAAIRWHDLRTEKGTLEREKAGVESQILFDVDQLEAFGVKGIFRYVAVYSGRLQDPNVPGVLHNVSSIAQAVPKNALDRWSSLYYPFSQIMGKKGYEVLTKFFSRLDPANPENGARWVVQFIIDHRTEHPQSMSQEAISILSHPLHPAYLKSTQERESAIEFFKELKSEYDLQWLRGSLLEHHLLSTEGLGKGSTPSAGDVAMIVPKTGRIFKVDLKPNAKIPYGLWNESGFNASRMTGINANYFVGELEDISKEGLRFTIGDNEYTFKPGDIITMSSKTGLTPEEIDKIHKALERYALAEGQRAGGTSTFRNMITEVIEKIDLTDREVSALLELPSATSLSGYKRGLYKPKTREMVIKIARRLGIDENDLLLAWASEKAGYQLREGDKSKILKEGNPKGFIFGPFIRQMRLQSDYKTLTQLSRKIGVGTTYLSNIELSTGSRPKDGLFLTKLAEALKVNKEDLLWKLTVEIFWGIGEDAAMSVTDKKIKRLEDLITKYDRWLSTASDAEEMQNLRRAIRVLRIQLNTLNQDPAMRAPGGIDLNTGKTTWTDRKEGLGVEMKVDPAMVERVQREGIDSLSPEIYSITPVVSIWSLIGLNPPIAKSQHL